MISGILKDKTLENMPIAEVNRRSSNLNADNEKSKQQDEAVRNEEIRNDPNKDRETELAIEKIVDTAKFFNRKINFEVEKDLNIVIVKIIDGETGEVVRQIPPEELVALSKNAKELKGLLINTEG